MLSFTLKVLSVEKETDDTVTLFFKQPLLKKVKYVAGQYLTLIFRINGRRYIRPYSFSSTPGVDETLNITVKRMLNGVVSNHILDTVKAGDLIEVMQPMGDFILPNNDNLINKHLIFWGSGSGITPLMSMIKYLLHQQSDIHITLVYGNRSKKTTIFLDQIEKLQVQYANKFSVLHFHTKATFESSNPYVIQGRIAPEKILTILKNEGNPEDMLHYICGPSGLKESIKTTLQSNGTPEKNIFTEDFEIVRSPEDFEGIITQQVSIRKDHKLSIFEVVKGKSILEAGLDTMLELEYSCQTGSCLLCKGTLINGNIKMIGADKNKINADECLLCCSFPLTNDVEIEIN